MTHEAGAACAPPEQEPDLSAIPPEVIAAGGRLGMTAAGIAGIYMLSPDTVQQYADWQPPLSDRARVNFDRIGAMTYGSNEFTRGLIARIWRAQSSLVNGDVTANIEAAARLGAEPALAFLENVPAREAEYLCRAAALWGGGETLDANLNAMIALAKTGALQHLYDGRDANNFTGRGESIASYDWSDKTRGDEERAAYCSRRNLLAEIASDNRFRRYAASEFGMHTMYTFLLRFTVKDKSDEQVHAQAESFLDFLSDDENAAMLERITAAHPHLLDTLNPMTSDYGAQDMAQYCKEFADAKPGTFSNRTVNLVTNRTTEERLFFMRLCTDSAVNQIGNDRVACSNFWEAGVPWALGGPETFEQKKQLLKDPVFVKGLVAAGTLGVRDRFERISQRNSDEPLWALIEGLYGVDSPKAAEMLFIRPREETRKAVELFTDFYAKYGLDCYELLSRWEEAGMSKIRTQELIREHLETMDVIEQFAPGEQVCRWLRQDRQIRHFGRYGAATLWRQWQERDETNIGSGIGLFASNDGNTSLYKHASEYLPDVIDRLGDCDATMRLYEAASPREALIALARARRKYGAMHCGYAAVHGMDQVDGTCWGRDANEISYPEDIFDRQADGTYALPESNLTGLGAVFVPGAPVGVATCYGARETQLPATTRGWAIATGTKVHSSAHGASLVDTEITRGDDGLLSMKTTFESDSRSIPTVTFDGQKLRRQPDPQSKFRFAVPSTISGDETVVRINDVIKTMNNRQT
jgi:hypothetical protein